MKHVQGQILLIGASEAQHYQHDIKTSYTILTLRRFNELEAVETILFTTVFHVAFSAQAAADLCNIIVVSTV